MNSSVWGNEQQVSLQGHPSHPLPWHAGLVLSAASHPSLGHAWQVQILPQMPGTPSNNSGPFAATFLLFLPSPEKLLESQLGGNKSPFLPIPPYLMSHADRHTHTRGIPRVPLTETQTAKSISYEVQLWLYSKIFNSWSFTPKLFPKGVYAGPWSRAPAETHKSGLRTVLWLSPKTSSVTTVPNSACEWLHHWVTSYMTYH